MKRRKLNRNVSIDTYLIYRKSTIPPFESRLYSEYTATNESKTWSMMLVSSVFARRQHMSWTYATKCTCCESATSRRDYRRRFPFKTAHRPDSNYGLPRDNRTLSSRAEKMFASTREIIARLNSRLGRANRFVVIYDRLANTSSASVEISISVNSTLRISNIVSVSINIF